MVADHGPVAAKIALLDAEDVLGRLVVGDRRLAPEHGECLVAHLGRLVPELHRAEIDLIYAHPLGRHLQEAYSLTGWPASQPDFSHICAIGRLLSGRTRGPAPVRG